MVEEKSIKKTFLPPSLDLYPLPIVLVSCIDVDYKMNILTVSNIGVINHDPPLIYVSIKSNSYSNKIIKRSREFVVNIPSEDLLEYVDFCGNVSGERIDKFKASNLTPVKATHVITPLIDECPVNLECRVQQIITLNSHDLIIAEILGVHVDSNLLGTEQQIKTEDLKPLVYIGKEYWNVKKCVAKAGFTLEHE